MDRGGGPMNSLVIGGNGFIGSHVVELLGGTAGMIRVLDLGAARADFDWSGIDYRQAAFTDAGELDRALEGVDVVYHLASSTVPGTSNADPLADIEGNLAATVRLLERMRHIGTRRIVYFSSGGTVYGNPLRLPIAEDHPTDPISSYGVVKLAVEKYLQMYQRLHGLAPLILRPSNPYGPRQGTAGIQGVIAAFLDRCSRGEPVRMWGDGSVVRDYVFVTDLAALAVKAGSTGTTGIYNVGSGQGHSINQILDALARVLGTAPMVDRQPGRTFDVSKVVLDISRARQAFDWQPEVSLDEGLARTWAWIRSRAA